MWRLFFLDYNISQCYLLFRADLISYFVYCIIVKFIKGTLMQIRKSVYILVFV